MKLFFHTQYHTAWGEYLCVIINDNRNSAVQLSTQNGYDWSGETEYAFADDEHLITYRYAVFQDNSCKRQEIGLIPHILYRENILQNRVTCHDCWRDLPQDAYRYTSAFCNIHSLTPHVFKGHRPKALITFRAICPEVSDRGCLLGISGDCEELGNWKHYAPVRMHESQPNVWHVTFDTANLPREFEYKFVTIDKTTGMISDWERGYNRKICLPFVSNGETFFPMETEVFFNWPKQKIAGTAIPLFSLRSEGSCGAGDLGDLKALVEWAAETNQHIIQILPINDTIMSVKWTDSYPYNSITIYAFHLMYLDLRQLPKLKDAEELSRFEEARNKVNALTKLDYEETNRIKNKYLRAVFTQEKEKILTSSGFKEFFRNNKDWLRPYAAFCYLRDSYHTPDFSQWEQYATYNTKDIEKLCDPRGKHYDAISYFYFVQYELHLQLLEVSRRARKLGVILKGDIPIGISRTSVEAWTEPHYFNMNGQAGAPPDAFSTNGQNWGMPTYNWEAMKKDNYRWWKQRFRKMSEYFTAYRIDHILGFFRIWEIPYHSIQGLLGQFSPALPMSEDELRSFGFEFDESMARPFINNAVLESIFGDKSDEIKETFLQKTEEDRYNLREEFNTQRKIDAYFHSRQCSQGNRIRDGLFRLVNNVLFVRDHKQPELLHPRIAAQYDLAFRFLDKQKQEAFNLIHEHFYYHRHNEFWYNEAMRKLPMLTQSTPMLACGEDLGMVPECVPWVMQQLQILSLEIQRMPKIFGEEFGETSRYPFCSVCSIGTHDMSTLRGWWKENAQTTRDFYRNILGHTDKVPEEASGTLCEEVIRMHLQSPSMLCILTWQDWLSMDEQLRNPDIDGERINIPAEPNHYWCWRMHITIEQLRKETDLNNKIRQLITETGRA